MLVDLLKQEGISAEILGEHLQGAVGELPAAGLVRVVVSEADYDAARQVIARWESIESAAPPPPATSPRGVICLWYLVGGLVLGAAGMYAFVRSPVSTDGVDYNGDGLLDENWTYSPRGTPVRLEVDRNLDKQIDYVGEYDERGLLKTARTDDNFDGKFETTLTFRNGNIEASRSDSDGDGYPDLTVYFRNGVQDTTEFINPSTGRALRVEQFKLGKIVHADVDSDKDGTLDTRVTLSPLGQEVSRSPLVR